MAGLNRVIRLWPRLVLSTLFVILASLAGAHPGNGIVVLPDGSVITGDAVGSNVWRFRSGAAPELVISNLHCHWVTLGKDGNVYAETQSNDSGTWQTTIHKIDLKARKAHPVLKGPQSLSVFLVDKDSSILALVDGVLQRFAGGRSSPYKGNGRPSADDQTFLDGDSAMAWGLNGEVLLLCGNRLWTAGADGSMKIKASFIGTAYGLYAAPGNRMKPWGVTVDGAGSPIVADPSTEQVFRIEKDGKWSTLDWTKHEWAALGVSVYQGRIYLVESKTIGNRNLGPRVAVLEKDGKKRVLGTVGPQGDS
jgi:hypothetical protein